MSHHDVGRDAGALVSPRPLKSCFHSALDKLMRFELIVARVESRIAMASWLVATLSVLASLVIRAFALPIPDTGEWALVAMSPLTFVGAALCSHLHKHLTADIVEMLPRGTLLQVLEAVIAILFIIFSVFLSALALDLFDYALSSSERLTDLGTPLAVPVAFILLGALLMGFHAIVDLLRACAGRSPGGINPW
ncbi:TRAP transporter small permease [Bordetella muralis]|jgi:TRAP-type C4-dicarboxylate transport system permease small subunit|uniref:TRAP transporter small permease n=1 Tax=Bordetella muralis TaxID=1649130 RepID=UPI0039EFE45F